MKLTLRECLTFGGLTDATVVAGQLYLDREILNVSILEIAHPMVSQWVSHHELYISSFYSIKDNPIAQEHVVKALANCGCTGLILGHLGLWFKTIPQSLIDLCNNLQFPLIVANPEISYLSIMNPIFKRLINWKPQEIGFVDIRRDIIEIALQEKSLIEGLKKVSLATNTMMSVFDVKFRCEYSNKTEVENNQEEQLLRMKIHEDINVFSSGYAIDYCFGIQKLIIPVFEQGNHFVQGYIVLNVDEDSLENSLKLVDSLRIAFSVLLSKRAQTSESRSEYKMEYWKHLINWDFQSDEAALKMGIRCGIDMTNIHYILVIKYHGTNKSVLYSEDTTLDTTIFRWLVNRSKVMSNAVSKNNFQVICEDHIVHLMNDCQTDPEYALLADRFLKLFSENENVAVTVGISQRLSRIKDIASAYHEVMSSIEISRQIFGDNRIVRYSDIWFIDYLNKLRDDDLAVQMSRRMLQPLMEAAKDGNQELLNTFKLLIENNDDVSEVASILNVHRNTIIYRRKKILDLLSSTPFQNPKQFMYYAALNIILS